MPDVFVALDTSGSSNYYSSISSKGLVNEFAYKYLDNNRKLFRKYKSFDEYNKSFNINEQILNEFVTYAEKNGVKRDEAGIKTSSEIINTQLKALIARQVWKNEGFYAVIHTMDQTLKKALELLDKKQVTYKTKKGVKNKSL